MTSTDIDVRGGALAVGADQTSWTPQQIAVLRSAGVSEEVTPAELDAFLHECQRTRLDPFSKQIYLIGRYDNQLKRKVFRSQTGIDGYRVVAHRVAREDRTELEYEDTVWCGPDGVWRDVWLAERPPAAAKVVVYKGGKRYSAVATLEEYAARYPDGNPYPMWRRMPANQLEKCAEAKALRRAFPNDLGSIYTAEEMEQADARDARPAPPELTVEQAAAQMRRNHPETPAADEWSTDTQPAATPDETRPPTKGQLQQIAMRLDEKTGISDRARRLATLSDLLGRELTSMRGLTYTEAEQLLGKLKAMPDRIVDAEIVADGPVEAAPNPRNGDSRPLAPDVADAYTAAFDQARTPDDWSEQDAEQLAEDFVTALDGARNDRERVEIAQQIGAAVKAGKITPEHREVLLDRYRKAAQPQQPAPPAGEGWSHQRLGEMTGAAA